MNVTDILQRLENVRNTGAEHKAKCPAHRDSSPSLSVREGTDGRVLLYCHAGCTTEAVVEALGLRMTDLMPETKETSSQSASQMVATYDYRDESGTLLYQAVRKVPKAFVQRRPDGRGGWIWNLGDVRRVPYRLPELISAVRSLPAARVFKVEGEKDADRLWSLGIPATCNAGGAGKWGRQETEALMALPGRPTFVIIPDNDLAGVKDAAEVRYQLEANGLPVMELKLPSLPVKGDVSDWLDQGHDAQELLRLCGVADQSGPKDYHLTDSGNADRLVDKHGPDLRYCHTYGKWLIYADGLWQIDETGTVIQRARGTVKTMYEDAASLEDPAERKALVRHALASESESRLRAMVSLAQSDPRVVVTPNQLDADPWLLTVQNGTLDLLTGTLQPHRREDLMTKVAPVPFMSEAICPTWESFLERIMGGNQDLIRFLQRAVGYSLTGQISEQVLFFAYGTGANGKSTFIETIRTLLGDYARQADFSTFLARDTDNGARNDVARLVGARFVAAAEVEAGKRLSEVVIKQLTGGDRIAARFLFREHFEFTPTFKVWFAGNHKPTIRGTDEGIWRRVRLIPFNVTIPEAERDRGLSVRLQAELPGILNWAVQGCGDWRQQGLGIPTEVREATATYRDEMDVLAQFLEGCCVLEPNVTAPASQLYERYKEWAEENGERPLSQTALGRRLTERGLEKYRTTGGRFTWKGIGVTAE